MFSNASDHYAILTKNESYVLIDRTGDWNKFLEIKKVLGIDQQPKKLQINKKLIKKGRTRQISPSALSVTGC